MTARHHHYVPQLYLRHFANDPDNASLFVVDLHAGKTFTTQPRNVAAERDFNRVDVAGLAPDALEARYADFEGVAASALGRIAEARSIGNEADLIVVLNLATLLAVRNPGLRGDMADFMERVSKTMLGVMLSTPERWAITQRQMTQAGYGGGKQLSYEQMKDFFDRDEYGVTYDRQTHIRMELESFNSVLPYFVRRKWRLMRTRKRSDSFITCDHPVCNVWTTNVQRSVRRHGPGYAHQNSEVLFPLTRDLALVGRFDGPVGDFDVGTEYVAAYNSTVAKFARRQVYARDANFQYYSRTKLRRGAAMKGDRHFARDSRTKRTNLHQKSE